MEDNNKTKEQLIKDLKKARRRIAELEILESKYNQASNNRDATLKMATEIIENIPAGVSIHDMEGKVIEVNRAATELLGYAREELIGITPLDLVKRESELVKILQALFTLSSGESIHNAEFQVVHKDGSVFPTLVDVSVLKDSTGNPISIIAVFEDITERKRKGNQLNVRELAILKMIADGITTSEIGTRFFLSETTIKRNVHLIFQKFGVRNRSEAVAEAYKRNLI